MKYDICIVGGAGHVGAPLAVVLASRGFRTLIYDTNESAVRSLLGGRFPFMEEGGGSLLREVLAKGMLAGSSRPEDIAGAESLIVTIGTPVDEFQNPIWDAVTSCLRALLPHMPETKLVVLRSTVAPGTTERLQRFLDEQDRRIPVAFCPERVVQGKAIHEIQDVPQIISGTSPEAERAAAAIFGRIAVSLVRLRPMEAEMAKLFCNAYRYIQFAASNQFYMMAQSAGCDYAAIVDGIKRDYPRMSGFPSAGLAAGPCLQKDTLQLAVSSNYQFQLGYAAIQANEGLPAFIVEQMRARHPLAGMTVGVLGMAFKSEIDDVRSSLSYKLKKLIKLHAREVLTTDPYVTTDRELLPLETVLAKSDLLVIGAPHKIYAKLARTSKPVIDIWNLVPAPSQP